jgi:hypothetical protein
MSLLRGLGLDDQYGGGDDQKERARKAGYR